MILLTSTRESDIPMPSSGTRDDAEFATDLELAIVVPTFNEIDNIGTLIAVVQVALEGHAYEIIVVDDDSPDGTGDRVRQIAKRDRRVRCIQRIGRRGLSGAFIEGALATAASMVSVIDGDMQHDEMLLPAMLKTLRSSNFDVVIGSRYLEQGGLGNWTGGRIRLSRWATALARRATGVTLSDPMSGLFMVRSDVLRRLAPKLSGIGFKILLDIFITAPEPLRFIELPYQFRARTSGTSKMDSKVMLEFFELLIDKALGHFVPAKFVIFALVGSLGVVVHLFVLILLFKELGFDIESSQIVATLVAMTSNFALNTVLTYYDCRLFGWAWIRGWFSFALASSIGALANVGIATYLFRVEQTPWLLSAVAGVLVGVVWNYTVTALFTWKRA
jgi:dolichol-phosphate mannosyltransferase